MPAGTEKEKAMNDFGHKVIREGLDALEKSVSKSLDTVSDMIAEELDGMAKQQKLNLENFAAQLQDCTEAPGATAPATGKTACLLRQNGCPQAKWFWIYWRKRKWLVFGTR